MLGFELQISEVKSRLLYPLCHCAHLAIFLFILFFSKVQKKSFIESALLLPKFIFRQKKMSKKWEIDDDCFVLGTSFWKKIWLLSFSCINFCAFFFGRFVRAVANLANIVTSILQRFSSYKKISYALWYLSIVVQVLTKQIGWKVTSFRCISSF